MLRYIQRPGASGEFERPDGMSPLMHRLLAHRGITSAAQAQQFLNPSEAQLNDPFLLNDMHRAVDRIQSAVRNDLPICIYGDYDVDGVCASAILYTYFKSIGARAQVYLPSRHNEGYGLNENALREIAKTAKLLITVDCGISARELIAFAEEAGLSCVVTDHHRPGEQLPECPVVNPLLNDYPCPVLCGAGVALKLVEALGGRSAAMDLIDFAAIATVADIVPLTGENRAIVHLGLARINRKPRPGIRALMETARLEPGSVDSQAIGFKIAPRLNAGGRLGSARRSYELLIQTDDFLAVAQADELEQENTRRQSIEQEIRRQALAQLENFDFSAHRIIIVSGENWNSGVIGLAASHLREQFFCPVIVFSESDGMLTGSCRSIEGVDIYQTLASAAHLIEKFGGHRQAAGLTIRKENLPALQAALDAYLFENIDPRAYIPCAEYDIAASLDEFSESLVAELAALEPTGCANPEPVFRSPVQLIEARAIGAQGAHLRLICSQNGARRTGIFFGAGERTETLGENADILYTPQLNTWNGRTSVQLRLSALRDHDLFAKIEAAAADEGVKQRKFLTQLFYNMDNDLMEQYLPVSLEEIQALLLKNAQGALILCADLDGARHMLENTSALGVDVAIGKLCDDPRMFNTISAYPQDIANWPRALRTIILAGVPAPDNLPKGVDVRVYDLKCPLFEQLPDVDQMRLVYKACLHLARRPVRLRDLEALLCCLSEETDLSPVCCLASLAVLKNMKLISWTDQPFAFSLPPMHKTDPRSSALWRRLQTIKASY